VVVLHVQPAANSGGAGGPARATPVEMHVGKHRGSNVVAVGNASKRLQQAARGIQIVHRRDGGDGDVGDAVEFDGGHSKSL
jgi:hypothetical protein